MIRYFASRLAFWISVAYLLCDVCTGQVAGNMSGNRSTRGQFFFGTSQDAKSCPSAWLLNIAEEHRSGGVFVATEMIRFSRFEVGVNGTVILQWKGFGDKEYQFNGTLLSGELAGDIQLIDKHSGGLKHLCDMRATQLPPQNAHASSDHQVPLGRYSNARYFNESGDLTGVEIRFLSTSRGTEGMIVFYSDYWDEPTFTPLAVSQIKMGEGTIHFAAVTPSGLVHYHLRLTHAGAFFNQDDLAADQRSRDIPLKRRQDVLPTIGW